MSAPTDRGRVLEEFRTGFQSTRITAVDDRLRRWRRTTGPDRTTAFSPVVASFVGRARAASAPDVRFDVPVSAGPHECVWEVDGELVWGGVMDPGDETHAHVAAAARLGARLRGLHDAAGDGAGELPAPRGPVDLATWIDDRRGPRASSGFHRLLQRGLGPARWQKLRELTLDLLHPGPSEPTTVLHGWFSLGDVVVTGELPGAGPSLSVLSGPDAATGRPEVDLGFLVGELTEYRDASASRDIGWPSLDLTRDALVAGYGGGWDRGALAAAAIMRIAVHARYFAAYVGWADQLHGYVGMLADLLDTDGATTVPAAGS